MPTINKKECLNIFLNSKNLSFAFSMFTEEIDPPYFSCETNLRTLLIIYKILRICIKKEDTVLSDIFYIFMAERGGFEPPHGRPV